jgi:hypothetical protein
MIISHYCVTPIFRAADWIDPSPRRRPSTEARQLVANITSRGLDVNLDARYPLACKAHECVLELALPAEAIAWRWRLM